jgi:hypothetical protein
MNTCLSKAVDNTPPVQELVETCKALATRTHQSTLDWNEIKMACKDEGITPNKIIQSVSTRWNSNFMMMNSILNLKVALMSIKDNILSGNKKFKDLLPQEEQYSIIEAIKPFLEKCKVLSEKWSSDQKVTIHQLQAELFVLDTFCQKELNKKHNGHPVLQELMKNFLSEWESRLPVKGTEEKLYNFGSFFNPYLRGHALTAITGKHFLNN